MVERSSDAAPQFDGYPYLALWLTDDCCHLVCLPRADDARLRGWARDAHAATGLAVQLVTDPERSVLVDPFGECDRAGFTASRVAIDDQLVPASLAPHDEECAQRSRTLAAYCRTRAAEGHDLASLGAAQLQRLAATLANVHARQARAAAPSQSSSPAFATS